jgi:hypothetical protein
MHRILLFLHFAAAGKKVEAADLPLDQQPVFSISPDKLILGPKETTTCMITGFGGKPGEYPQHFNLTPEMDMATMTRNHLVLQT